MIKFTNKLKVYLIAVLVILVAGMTVLGLLGFNQNLDNKASYEMQVSVDQIVGDSVSVLKTSADEAVNGFGGMLKGYSYQEMNSGATLVYKFNYDVSDKIDTVKTAVQTALDNSSVSGVKAEVKVYENDGDFYTQTLMAVLAVGIAVVVIFLYALIMTKLSGGVSVLCSSVLSVLLFTALMALTRIPAQPFFAILAAATVALSSAISLVITTSYKVAKKHDQKSSALELANGVNSSLRKVYLIISLGILVTAIIAGAACGLNSIFLGVAILVAGISAVSSAVYMTPFIWSLIKGSKQK